MSNDLALYQIETADIRREVAVHFEALSEAQVALSVPAVVIECGGSINPPQPGGRGPLNYEISLLGVTGEGDTLVMAVRTWTKHALRMDAAMDPMQGAAA